MKSGKNPRQRSECIEGALREAKEAIESGDMNRIREKMELLTKASHHLAEIMYQQASAKQQARVGPGSAGRGSSGREAGGGRGRRRIRRKEIRGTFGGSQDPLLF